MKIVKIAQEQDKVNSSDCVYAIVADSRFSNTNPKDWKRQSKTKNAQGGWNRIFFNKSTNQTVVVVENDNKFYISLLPQVPTHNVPSKSKVQSAGNPQSPIYFFAKLLTKNNYEDLVCDGDEDSIGKYALIICPKECWDKKKGCKDYLPDNIYPILKELDFPPEEMEASFLVDENLINKIRQDNRFYESPELKDDLDEDSKHNYLL